MDILSTTAQKSDTKLPRDQVLRDFLQYARKVTHGLTSVAKTEAQELIQRLVEVGRITPEQGEKLLSTLVSQVEKSQRLFETRMEASVRKASERIEKITQDEITTLIRRIESLEKKIDQLRS